MKLTIRSDIASNINALLTDLRGAPLYVRFGKMKRNGFEASAVPHDVESIKNLSRKWKKSRYTVSTREREHYCDVGDVANRRLLLATAPIPGNGTTVTCFENETFNVLLLHDGATYSIELEFTKPPVSIQDLFTAVKFVFGQCSFSDFETASREDIEHCKKIGGVYGGYLGEIRFLTRQSMGSPQKLCPNSSTRRKGVHARTSGFRRPFSSKLRTTSLSSPVSRHHLVYMVQPS